MNRVLLINRKNTPSREELSRCERRTGELLFADFPNLRWGGYLISQTHGKKGVNWIIPTEDMEAFTKFASQLDSDNYAVEVFTDGTGRFGGQCEVKIV